MKYFGTDGIRGNENTFTVDFLEKIAWAVVARYGRISVVIGRDTRRSGERIANTLAAAWSSCGLRVIDAGMIPTPVLAYLTRSYGAGIGVMISASHNPPEYNGVKFFSRDGAKITTDEESDLEAAIDAATPPERERGEVLKVDGSDEYCAHFAARVAPSVKGMRVLLDVANGAVSAIAEKLYSYLGAVPTVINSETDGERINVGCGATHPEVLVEAMKKGDHDIGFTFDGDGDRVMCVKNGKLYDGDAMMYVAARYFAEKGVLSPPAAVGTVMTNMGTELSLKRNGITFRRTPVGDKYVSEAMIEEGALIGGEASGHIIFRAYQNTGDGLLTSLIMCVVERERGLENLDDRVEYPSASCNIDTDAEGIKRFDDAEVKEFIEKARAEFQGRIIARASGTEPKIRLMAEAERYEKAREVMEKVRDFVDAYVNQKNQNKATENNISGYLNDEKRKRILAALTAGGVRVADPATTYIDEECVIGAGTVVYPMCVLQGKCVIGENVKIYSFTDITDTVVGDNSDLRSVYAIGATIGARTTVGPFACLRKGAVIGDGCRVGDFVEVKNSVLADGVKAAHLAYIGDAEVGERTNVGCGTVFANYNGSVKQTTRVGKEVFIGCNANLIAPVEVGDGAYIAGGSTVTENVPPEALCIARSRQTVKTGWKSKK